MGQLIVEWLCSGGYYTVNNPILNLFSSLYFSLSFLNGGITLSLTNLLVIYKKFFHYNFNLFQNKLNNSKNFLRVAFF